ncbi:MAG: hypothetical protein H6Q53_1761, partial [Deltaproteobacteria bacterium]|nr:hypothetical protein [Deltaproteobacteria bacterium]
MLYLEIVQFSLFHKPFIFRSPESPQLLKVVTAGKDNSIHGEFRRDQMGIEKMDGEYK